MSDIYKQLPVAVLLSDSENQSTMENSSPVTVLMSKTLHSINSYFSTVWNLYSIQ